MGRHSRPTAAQQARTTTLKAATALGVAGTIAFGLHSTVGGDKSVEARSDVNAQQAQAPEIEPTADHTPSQSHVAPSESTKPKLISDHTDAATPGGGSDRSAGAPRHAAPATPDAAPSKAAPTMAPTAPAQRDDQVPASPSTPSETAPSADPTTPSQQPSQPSQTPGEGGHHGKGLVGGLVDGVGDTLDGVLGGVGSVLGG
ncbi:extensin [Streptomyces rugosispiralis]|uniref:Extensin n=1 Tax=Streptomyces rugosispiralis TaxID=2967341 RepID=A0ABT1V0A0_9ACTN|nr:extensin [Streptomyces rugosispiralis]MCQ8190811.1 extensin [Streptomyces rugosispiralis]